MFFQDQEQIDYVYILNKSILENGNRLGIK